MPVGMDFPPPFTMLEAKDSAFVVDDQKSGDLNDIKPMTKGKPPRHASTLRHSISNTRLLAISDLVSLSSSSAMSLLIFCCYVLTIWFKKLLDITVFCC